MLRKIGKGIIAASPCILLLVGVAGSIDKSVEAEQPETVAEYDMEQLQTLIEETKSQSQTQLEETEKEKKSETETKSAAKADFKDGTYYGTGTGFAGKIKVCVVVKDGKIQSIEVTEVEKDDAAFVQRAKGVIDEILKTQTLDVDAVSGATYSSRGILEAVKNALTGETSSSTAVSTTAASQTAAAPATVAKYEEPKSGYKDGTYYGEGTGFGGKIRVEVRIKNGKIKKITVTEAAGEGASYLESAKKLIPNILKKQSPDVDAVSGATYTSNGILNAVQDALEQAQQSQTTKKKTKKKNKTNNKKETEAATQPQTENVPYEKPSAYRDGTYTAKSKGFRGEMTVTVVIAGGKITDIQVSAKDDEAYLTKAKQLISQILAAQDVSGIDAVSGATYSSTGILNGVKLALQQAAVNQESESETETETEKETETEPVTPSGLYQDGTYTGTGQGYIYQISATVTISGGRITSITAESLEDADQEEWLDVVQDTLVGQVLKTQSAQGIDAVSGATYSSKGLMQAISEALEQAKKEEEQT